MLPDPLKPKTPLDYEATPAARRSSDKRGRVLTAVATFLMAAGLVTYAAVWLIAFREGMVAAASQAREGNHGAFRHLYGARRAIEFSLVINGLLLPVPAVLAAMIAPSRRSVAIALVAMAMFIGQIHLLMLVD
jgi:hypothetical protein